MTMEAAIFKTKVSCGYSHSVIVTKADRETSATVVVIGGFMPILFTLSTDGTTTVEVILTVLVEGVTER